MYKPFVDVAGSANSPFINLNNFFPEEKEYYNSFEDFFRIATLL